MKWEKDDLVFETTGRSFYANGYVGIKEVEGEIYIAEGYDGKIYLEPRAEEKDFDFAENELTPNEREELADYMISLWQKFRELGKT